MGSLSGSLGRQGLGLWMGGGFGLVMSPSWARSGGAPLCGLLCEGGGCGRGDV